MKKMFLPVAMAGLLLSLGSCVSKKEFTKLQTDYT